MVDGEKDSVGSVLEGNSDDTTKNLPILLSGFWTWDIPNDRVYGCSKMIEYFGVKSEAAATGLSIVEYADRIDPRDRDRVNAAVERAITRHVPYEETFRINSPTYGTRVIKARGCCQYDPSGRATVFPGYFNDLSAGPPLSASPTQTSRHLIALARDAAAADGNTVLCYLLEAALREADQPSTSSIAGPPVH